MKACFTSKEIPLSLPTEMDGYMPRTAQGIHDNPMLYTAIIDSGSPVVFHIVDVLLIEASLSERIKKRICQAFCLPRENVVVAAIHTHAGPLVCGFTPEAKPDEAFLQAIEDVAVENTKQCLEQRENACVEYAATELSGYYTNRNSQALAHDSTGHILRFTRPDGSLLGSFIQIACHPTVLNHENRMISSDIIHPLRKQYEEATAAPCMVVNGSCGDASTRFLREGTGFDEVVRVGGGIARQLLQATGWKPVAFENLVVKAHEETICFTPDEQNMFAHLGKVSYTQTAYVYQWDGMRIVALPGEYVWALGRRFYERSDRPTLMVAYANDYHGYAVNDAQYGEYFESFATMYPDGAAEKMVERILALYEG